MRFGRRSPTLLVSGVIAFAVGISATALFPETPSPPLFLPFFPAIALIFAWRTNHAAQTPLLLLFLLLCGLLHGSYALAPPSSPSSLYRLFAAEEEATVSGVLIEAPSIAADKTKLVLRATGIIRPPDPSRQAEGEDAPLSGSMAHFTPASGKIELHMRGAPTPDIVPGATILARARISRPTRYETPGSFNYPAYLAEKSVYVTGWISSPSLVKTIAPAVSPGIRAQLAVFPETFRHRINSFLDTRLPADQAGLYKALLTGDRSSIPATTLENFKASGAFHLLAISGLHMGLVALGLGLVINFFLRRSTWLLLHAPVWKIAALLTLPLLIFYALIAGFQAPVMRALIMTSVFLVAVVVDRQWHIPTNIALAALIILSFYPASLFSASFQLSFAAVISRALILPKISGLPSRRATSSMKETPAKTAWAFIRGAALVSCAATAGILPLLVFYFNRFSPLSVFSTLLLEPLLCFWALPWGLASCPFILFAPETAHLFLQIGLPGIKAAEAVSHLLASLPFSSVWLTTPTLTEIAAFYLFFGSLLFVKKNVPARFVCVAALLVLTTFPSWQRISSPSDRKDSVAVLDVGQGNSTLVGFSGRKYVLIDGGGAWSDRFDVGTNVIAPYLWKQRISRLESVVISHPDADHYNGLFFVLERFAPKTLWVNGNPGGPRYAELLALARRLAIPIRVPAENETVLQYDTSRLVNIANLHQTQENLSDNGKSLVIRFDSQGKHFLFTGDIDKEAETKLTENKESLKTDVLLLAHHGSSSSSSEPFLAATNPVCVVISAGKRRKNMFPAADVLSRCRNMGFDIYSTATDGTITFSVADKNISATTFAGGNTIYQTSVKSDGGLLKNWTNLPLSMQFE